MTNAEFYKNEIRTYAFSNEKIAVRKDTLKLCKCSNLFCEDCLFQSKHFFQSKCSIQKFVKWCNSECMAQIDSRITKSTPIDTKILVSEDGINWCKRHFAKIKGNKVYTWSTGTTSFTTNQENITAWTYAKLYEE